MKEVVFITGNQQKAEYLARLLGCPIEHEPVDVDEIQSLDLYAIVERKLDQAYAAVGRPVLVEDVGLECPALGGLPGPFIKWFLEAMSHEAVCRLLDGKDRTAIARTVFGYFDGQQKTYFTGSRVGQVSEHPAGTGGFGWDPIYIPEGYSVTRAELSPEEDEQTYRAFKPLTEIRAFLTADD